MTSSPRTETGTRRGRRAAVASLLVAAIALLALHSSSPASARTTAEQRARAIGTQAYIYGRAPIASQNAISRFPANQLISLTELATPTQRLVVAPNNDTLYTVARLVLDREPYVLHVPDEHGRYYVHQLLDAYTRTFAYIGSTFTGRAAGDFAILGPRWHGRLPAGVRGVRATTPVVWLLGRTLVRGPVDVGDVQAIQRQYTLTPLSRFGGPPLPALYLPRSPLRPIPPPGGLAYFDALGDVLAANPPPASERSLLRRFQSVGIGPGRHPSTEGLDPAIRRGLAAGVAAGERAVIAYGNRLRADSQRRNRGWSVAPPSIGSYGTDYLLRAYIARIALGAATPAQAIYPFAYVDSRLRTLTGAHRYVLHFAAHELPPVKAFWSLTMYDKAMFLVPNAIDRYSIGDRTPGVRRNRDGSLDIYVQSTRPRGHASNWLPAPPGAFVLSLRLYQPKPAAQRNRWPFPLISRVG